MRRICDRVLVLAFALVLVGPALLFVCEKAHVELPGWMSSEDARYLAGGVTEVNVSQHLSLEGFSSGELQQAVGDEIGNRIPFKAMAMLGNASLQRLAIMVANVPKGCPVYHTYFGSSRLYMPQEDAVTYMPYKCSQEMLDSIGAFGEELAQAASRHPDSRFVVCLPKGYQEPAVNPAYSLMSNPVRPEEFVDVLRVAVGDTPNVLVVSPRYDTTEEYYRDFFRTDHHWDHLGIERTFNDMADWLDMPAFEGQDEVAFGDYRFSGATARWGLDLVEEEVRDTSYDFSWLSVRKANGTEDSYNHKAFTDRHDPGKRYGFYDSYYGYLGNGDTVYGSGERRALVIANSYGAGIVPYLAQGYGVVRLSTLLHPSAHDKDARLSTMLDEGGYDDVMLVANPTDLSGFVGACPSFLAP